MPTIICAMDVKIENCSDTFLCAHTTLTLACSCLRALDSFCILQLPRVLLEVFQKFVYELYNSGQNRPTCICTNVLQVHVFWSIMPQITRGKIRACHWRLPNFGAPYTGTPPWKRLQYYTLCTLFGWFYEGTRSTIRDRIPERIHGGKSGETPGKPSVKIPTWKNLLKKF